MSRYDWETLLRRQSRVAIRSGEFDSYLDDATIASGWLGYPAASEEQIAATEARLGLRLPPSYREFLKISNGWREVTNFVRHLHPVERIERHGVRRPELVEAWMEAIDLEDEEISDEEYLVYEVDETQPFRSIYLPGAIEASEELGDGLFLLNPQVIDANGEWEAWFFASWIPGAIRYRSFYDLIRGQLRSLIKLIKHKQGRPTPRVDPRLGVGPTDFAGLVAALDRPARKERSWALQGLANLRDRRAVDAVVAILQNDGEDIDLRCEAARTLGELRDGRALATLLDVYLRGSEICAPAIRRKEARTQTSQDALDLRNSASQGLHGLGAESLPACIETLRQGSEEARAAIAEHLANRRRVPGVYEALLEVMDDPSDLVRASVVAHIDQLGDPRFVDIVRRGLADRSPEVRRAAETIAKRLGL